MCIQALKMTSTEHKDSESTICKTISCLLPSDLEVKRACQLTEFLLQPTVDSYYAVESLYNEPDQKPEEDGSLPVPNSLRCELLLALKTQWPFDPEFWDWKTLKRNCLALMGDEAAIVSSIDTLNDTDEQEVESTLGKLPEYKDLEDFLLTTTNELNEITDEKEKNREAKKLREQGFVSARFRNWRAYMQYCVLCDKEFLGHRIVRHAQKHFKDGVYLCPICADSFESREVLEPHVASHVKQSCKERLAAMKAARKVTKPLQSPKSPTKISKVVAKTSINPVKIEPEIGENLAPPVKIGQTTSDSQISQDCYCPVKNCTKAFKFFRNLMAHVRCHKDDEEAMRFLEIQKQKVVCQYCRRQFVNVRHLNDHLQMHCGSKPYICIQLDCKANFNSNSELLMHRKMHSEFKAQCMFPNCGQVFSEAYLLYDHEAQHYLTYTCQIDNCGKIFYVQSEFLSHQEHHRPNAAVNNFIIMNQIPPGTTKVELPPRSTPVNEDAHSAVFSFEKNITDVCVKEAVVSPCRSADVPREAIPMKVKHSIENMLNSMEGPGLKEPEKCYTPLTNPTPATSDANPPPDMLQAPHHVPEHGDVPPVYPIPSTTNPVASPEVHQNNDVQGNTFQKVLPKIMSPSQIKTEIPCSLQGYPSTSPAVPAESEENLHCCPSGECSRAYSTNKSLSRHVKKQHPEIFEDWKLAKKYNKVARITAKKGKKSSKKTGVLCNKPGMQQMDYSMGSSTSASECYPGSVEPVPITPMINPTVYPSWGCHNNPNAVMPSDMSQSWSSMPINNCYPETFNMNEYSSRSYPHWQADAYQTTMPQPSERDHSVAATHCSPMSHPPSDSSLMSQYVSSSLMLDNGGQMHNGGHQYGLMHTDSTAENADVRKSSATMIGPMDNGNSISTIDSLPDGSYHTSYAPSENSSLTQSSSVDVPEKCGSPEVKIPVKDANEIVKNENASTPGYEQMENSVDEMLSPNSVIHTDFPYDEDCPNAECQASNVDEKSGDLDSQKGKRSRLSKRTKWPAIIKDGKVICRRCFREFTSTKSLGGHLSKRSQCRPLDEIDLTADLPTSFLDFLNDPHVPDTNGSIFNMPNGEFSEESCSLTTFNSPIMLKQEPQAVSIMDHPSSLSADPEDQQKKGTELVNSPRAGPHREDHLVEMSHAFQKMDLIEAAQEKMRNALALELNASQSQTTPKTEKSKKLSKSEAKSTEKVSKPFKCEQDDCEFSFMTKEALFKHLSKMHDYTNEMIEELKRNPSKLSPYPCKICSKTFTRTTGLRIHYEKVHRLSKAEMLKLKINARVRRPAKIVNDASSNTPVSIKPNTSTVQSAPVMPILKQEPVDIAIAPQPIIEIIETNQSVPEIPNPEVAVKQVLTPKMSTVTRLPSPQNYLSEKQLEEAPPSTPEKVPEQPNVAVINRSPDVKVKSNVKEKQSPVAKANVQQENVEESPDKVQEPKTATASATSSPEKPSSSKSTPTKEERKEKTQKKLSLKMCETDNAFSPYRPYRCVHEGCTAAFTIQQNLILHYRAMHQASLPPTKTELDIDKAIVTNEQESSESIGKDDEVRCQVRNCSRVFMGITKLVQHYLLLHKFTCDKATSMMATMAIGTFNCDRPECALPFNSVEKYIEHIKNYHKEIAVSERGSVDPTFRCQYDACDRVYTTKSNLLRHLIKKHDYIYDPKANDGRRNKSLTFFPGINNGKENLENKIKVKKKNTKKKDGKSIEHWTSFGKPTLKSHEEASAMCTKKSALQYPCMLIGCDAVECAEKSIFKHYTTHGLTERYIEDQRSQFIFCKKYSRARFKDANNAEGASSSSEEMEAEEDEKQSDPKTEELLIVEKLEQEESKESNDDGLESQEFQDSQESQESQESQASTGTEAGPKRGRPRKPSQPKSACPERILTLRTRSTVSSSRENSNPGTPTAPEQQDDGIMPGSFKPLGLEDSFLKFLETSESTNSSKRKSNEKSNAEVPSKRQKAHKLKPAQRSKITNDIRGCENLIDFRNPLKLKSGSNVKIVMDKTLLDGAERLLKQLQHMKPTVVIKRWLYSAS